MRQYRFIPIVFVLSLLWPGRSDALIDLGQGDWMSGQNGILLKQLAAQLNQLTELGILVNRVGDIMQAGNEALSVTRSAYQQYQALRRFSLQDLMYDARSALYQAFPRLRDIEMDIGELGAQTEAVSDGTFFSFHGRHDSRMNQTMKALFDYGYQSTIWPMVFPNAFMEDGKTTVYPTPVDEEITRMYLNSGQLKDQMVKKTAIYSLAQQAKMFINEAQNQEEQNLKIMMEAQQTQVQTQQLSNSTEMLDLLKTKMAKEELARRRAKQRTKTQNSGIQKNMHEALMPGSLRKKADEDVQD